MNKANLKKEIVLFCKGKSIAGVIFGFIILIMIAACSSEKPQSQEAGKGERKYEKTVNASISSVTRFYEAVGTIRPANEASIEAQINSQIKKVLVTPGTIVTKGQPLVLLDDRESSSQLFRAKEGLRSSKAVKEQAIQRLEASKASLSQTEAEYTRTKNFFKSQAATSQQLENAESKWKQSVAGEKNAIESLKAAESGIKQAEEIVKQAEIILGYTIIKAPANGVVLKKTAEAGDIAIPGRQLFLIRTNSLLRIEANVREGLISKVSIGQKLDVEIKNMNFSMKAIVNEIEPYADPLTRTFLVKAELPKMEGLYPGMYGKLLIPEKFEEAVTIPQNAVKTVGQLQFVIVKDNEKWQKRFITTGMSINNNVEVLSGLTGTETIVF